MVESVGYGNIFLNSSSCVLGMVAAEAVEVGRGAWTFQVPIACFRVSLVRETTPFAGELLGAYDAPIS